MLPQNFVTASNIAKELGIHNIQHPTTATYLLALNDVKILCEEKSKLKTEQAPKIDLPVSEIKQQPQQHQQLKQLENNSLFQNSKLISSFDIPTNKSITTTAFEHNSYLESLFKSVSNAPPENGECASVALLLLILSGVVSLTQTSLISKLAILNFLKLRSSPSTSDQPPTSPSEPTKKMKPDYSCVVCMENLRSLIFRNCGHFVVCENCATRLSACPICLTPGDTTRIYFS